MLPGVRVFDVATGVEVRAFAGPEGALFASRERLYSVADGATSVWDPATGERIAVLDAVNPTSHNPWTGELASIEASQLIRWDTPQHPRLTSANTRSSADSLGDRGGVRMTYSWMGMLAT